MTATRLLIDALDRYMRQDETADDTDNGVYHQGREAMAAALSTPLASHAGAEPVAKEGRCPNCDDAGDVHSITGEWRGVCHCPAGQAINARTLAAPGAAIAAREQEATLAQLLQVAQIDVNEVRADGKPLTRADRFAARMSSNREGLTTEWRITFNTDYGLHESEDDLCAAILSAIKARHESTS